MYLQITRHLIASKFLIRDTGKQTSLCGGSLRGVSGPVLPEPWDNLQGHKIRYKTL